MCGLKPPVQRLPLRVCLQTAAGAALVVGGMQIDALVPPIFSSGCPDFSSKRASPTSQLWPIPGVAVAQGCRGVVAENGGS